MVGAREPSNGRLHPLSRCWMGLDGGTFASRADVLRRASWSLATADTSRSTRGGSIARGSLVRTVEQADSRELGSIRWSCCALTGEDLQAPIVACKLGALYNRESVLRFLLGKLSFPFNNQEAVQQAFGHITSLRCVFDVRLTPDPSLAARGGVAAPATASAMAGEATSDRVASSSRRAARFICPIVHCVADGRVPFVAIRPCGCVLSKRALTNLSVGGTDASGCPLCSRAYSSTLPVNGSSEEVAKLRQALLDAAASRKRKKEKKKKRTSDRGGIEGPTKGDLLDATALTSMPPPKRAKVRSD